MKDEEKQVDCDNCSYKDICSLQKWITDCNEWAKEFQCEYYEQKLPKDSVVLSREEYESAEKICKKCFPNNNEVYFFACDRDTANLLTRILEIANREGVELKGEMEEL